MVADFNISKNDNKDIVESKLTFEGDSEKEKEMLIGLDSLNIAIEEYKK